MLRRDKHSNFNICWFAENLWWTAAETAVVMQHSNVRTQQVNWSNVLSFIATTRLKSCTVWIKPINDKFSIGITEKKSQNEGNYPNISVQDVKFWVGMLSLFFFSLSPHIKCTVEGLLQKQAATLHVLMQKGEHVSEQETGVCGKWHIAFHLRWKCNSNF